MSRSLSRERTVLCDKINVTLLHAIATYLLVQAHSMDWKSKGDYYYGSSFRRGLSASY